MNKLSGADVRRLLNLFFLKVGFKRRIVILLSVLSEGGGENGSAVSTIPA
jgi:hypothetical protein